MKKITNNTGITLIALVITIIILLILTGVTIGALTGEKGLFSRALDAKEKFNILTIEEKMKMVLNEWQIEQATTNIKLEEFLSEKVENEEIDDFETDDENNYSIHKDGYFIVVDSNGKILKNIQKAGPLPKVSNIKITTDGTSDVADNSVKIGTKLQINFDTSIEGGTIKTVTPSLPYTTNGTETEIKFIVIGIVDGKEYKKTNKISLEKKYKSSIIKAQDIANAQNKKDYYGKIVTGYIPKNGAKINAWKIFYANTQNIYLIADDYLEIKDLPASTNGTNLTGKKPKANSSYSYQRTASFSNILNDYDGSSRITEQRIKLLNNDYFNTNTYSSTYDNMKAIAYMLDTKAWEEFKDKDGKADFAIGGPTIEMLIDSYNQKYNTNYKTKAGSNIGYGIIKNDETTLSNGYADMFSTSDELYIINSNSNAYGMWLASTSGQSSSDAWVLNYAGGLWSSSISSYTNGFRPVICLNSNVSLKENENGFEIQNKKEF